MNNSIYKKKIAFKQSLPQYKDGGKKFAAGLAGFATKIPMLGKVIDPMVSNTKLAQEYDTAFNAGQMAGGVANTVANAAVGNVAGAISSGADTMQEGLEMGSSIASNNNNTKRANRLNTAATAFGGLEQGAGMFNTSQFGQGFNPIQMFGGDAGIPLMMKNGGKLKQYNLPTHEDGGGAIDQNGKIVNPNSPLAVAELETKETLDTNQDYVFSDTLKPMKSKLTFADLSKRLENKYKGKIDDISINSKNKELERLAQANEEMRLAKEAKTTPIMRKGGNLPKYFRGGGVPEVTPQYPLIGALDNSWQTDMFKNQYSSNQAPTIPNEVITGEQDISPITAFGSEKALKRQTGYSYKDGILGKQTDNNPFKMTTGDKMQLGAGALSGITNLAMGLKKPEEYATLTSPYFGAGLADMNQNVRFNTNPILMNRNVGMNQINQGSTSDAVRRANLQSLTSNTNRALGELAEKEALANVGIKQDLGRAKIGVGQQDLAAREQSRAMNIQAKAIAQNLRAKGLEQIYGSVSDVGKGMNQSRTNTIQLNVLNSLAAQYGVDPKTMEIKFKELGYNIIR